MNHYILGIEFAGCDLWGVYSNTTDELLKAFKTIEEAKAYIASIDGSYY